MSIPWLYSFKYVQLKAIVSILNESYISSLTRIYFL